MAPFRAEVGLTDLVAAVLPLVFSLSVFTIQHSGSGTINFGGNMRVAGTTFVTIGGSTNYISGSLLDLGTPVYDVADGTDDVDLEVSNSHNHSSKFKLLVSG